MKLLLATHLLCTIGMFGVIWIVQLVHYPLFDRVEREQYVAFQQAHESRISLIVLPLMLGELATATLLAFRFSADATSWIWWAGLALVVLVWASTFFLSVPEHHRLGSGFDEAAHYRLVATNWVRTIAWTARSVLALYGTLQILTPVSRLVESQS